MACALESELPQPQMGSYVMTKSFQERTRHDFRTKPHSSLSAKLAAAKCVCLKNFFLLSTYNVQTLVSLSSHKKLAKSVDLSTHEALQLVSGIPDLQN